MDLKSPGPNSLIPIADRLFLFLIEGSSLAKLVEVFGDTLDDDLFKEKLGCVSIKQLTRTAKERRPGCMGYAEAMILEYNGKKKSNAYRLQINRLYSYRHSILRKMDSMQEDVLRDESGAFFTPDLFEEDESFK